MGSLQPSRHPLLLGNEIKSLVDHMGLINIVDSDQGVPIITSVPRCVRLATQSIALPRPAHPMPTATPDARPTSMKDQQGRRTTRNVGMARSREMEAQSLPARWCACVISLVSKVIIESTSGFRSAMKRTAWVVTSTACSPYILELLPCSGAVTTAP